MNEQSAPVRHVVFDWNGTLIDDCGLAVATVNRVRAHHLLPPISRETYRERFRFPIAAFYRDLGLPWEGERFAALMRQYLTWFDASVDECPLHAGATETLARLGAAGVGVHVLSASHHDTLTKSVATRGLAALFGNVMGLRHELAHGKHELAKELAAQLGSASEEVVYVGDTDHDYEVACTMGWRFVHLSHGHQQSPTGAAHLQVSVGSLSELCTLIVGH